MPSRRITVQQPSFLPWLGYFEQMDFADAFFFFDDVQYTRRSWRSRNRIRLADRAAYLTVPVSNARSPLPLIRDTKIQDGPWRRKHLRSIEMAYAKTPFFETVMGFLREQYSLKTDNLSEFNIHLTTAIAQWIGIETPLAKTSDLAYDRVPGQQRMLNVCRAAGADRHYTGQGARKLLDSRWFRDRGITVEYHVFDHPRYDQTGVDFIGHLSVVDALFCVGPQNVLPLIRQARRTPEIDP